MKPTGIWSEMTQNLLVLFMDNIPPEEGNYAVPTKYEMLNALLLRISQASPAAAQAPACKGPRTFTAALLANNNHKNGNNSRIHQYRMVKNHGYY